MPFEENSLCAYFLGEIDHVEDIGEYQPQIKWSKGYPRKLNGDEWVDDMNPKLFKYSEGKAYIDEMCNPSVKLNITGYPSGGIYSFAIVNGDKRTEWYYNPEASEKFFKI